MDVVILNYLNSLAGRWATFDQMVIFKAEHLGWWMLGGLGVFLVFASLGHRMSKWTSDVRKRAGEMVFAALVSGILSRFIITEIIRFFYDRPRPFEVLDVYQLVSHSGGGSFPSGHAAFFFAMAAAVFIYHKKWGVLFYLFALAIGVSRIVAGIHWPSDILGGAVIGIASAYFVNCFIQKYKKHSA